MGIGRLGKFVWSGEYDALCREVRLGRPEPRGELAEADCVLGFAFGRVGREPRIRPGVSNVQLASFAREHFPHLPAILQREIADAYSAPAPAILSIGRHRVAGRYLHTREVAEQARLLMAARGWRVAVLLAHGGHVPRALRVCERLGIRTVVPAGLERIAFCPDSSQPWTRNAGAWFRRERVTLLHHAWKGWI